MFPAGEIFRWPKQFGKFTVFRSKSIMMPTRQLSPRRVGERRAGARTFSTQPSARESERVLFSTERFITAGPDRRVKVDTSVLTIEALSAVVASQDALRFLLRVRRSHDAQGK